MSAKPSNSQVTQGTVRGADGFDSFNEDLTWILQKLVARTGGVAGTLCAQLTGASQPTLLAAVDCDDPPLTMQLNLRAAAVDPPSIRGNHDAPELTHSLLSFYQPDKDKRRYRILQLAFAPAEGVKVVATVAKESRLGFNFLDDANARRLYPVLSRYIRLWWVHRAERRSALALKAFIDLSDLAVILLNRTARLLFANSRASALLSARDGLTHDGQTIIPVAAGDREAFATAIAAGLDCNQANPNCQVEQSPILQIQRDNAKRDLIVSILPLPTPALDSEDPAVIVYGLDPDQNLEDLLAPVCAIYKLTKVEARLVGKLIAGSTIVEAAGRINIRPQTARAYLKNIFLKTRTHRQADLVRVMLSSTLRTSATR
jgi:DNA-binding CsgD family transcriptional regulator